MSKKSTSDRHSNQSDAQPNDEPPEQSPSSVEESHSKKPFDLGKLIEALSKSLRAEPADGAEQDSERLIGEYIRDQIRDNPAGDTYNIAVLYDELRMVKTDADHIYAAVAQFSADKPLLLVLYSTGGVIGSAYLIGKLCREYSNGKLVVVVPRQAKSAATLICCAADELHMGSLSELGPIDPQIDNLPALGLKASVEHIADLVKEHPHAADMFAKYLHMSLEPIHLGYYERVAESAAQYAERLLKLHKEHLPHDPAKIARSLVYSYKDHGFVIDKAEAEDIFGADVICTNTDEYRLGNNIYEALKFIARVSDILNYRFYFIGGLDAKPNFMKRKEN